MDSSFQPDLRLHARPSGLHRNPRQGSILAPSGGVTVAVYSAVRLPRARPLREPRTGPFACVRAERVAGSIHSGRVWRTRRPVELITPLRDRDVRFHSFSIPRFSRKAGRQMFIYDDEITTSSYAVSYKPPQSQTSFEIYLSYLRFLFLS